MKSIQLFNSLPFIKAVKALFAELHVPINAFDENPASAADVLGDKYNADHPAQ